LQIECGSADPSKRCINEDKNMNDQRKNQHTSQDKEQIWASIPIGAGFGVALGLVLMDIFDNPGFFAVGIGIGLCLGTTIGLALDQRKGQNDDSN
jgi:hypothetical protein